MAWVDQTDDNLENISEEYRITETEDGYNVNQENDTTDNFEDDAVARFNDRLDSYETRFEEFEQKLKSATHKSFEIIGLFSSVMALLIINVNIVSSSHSLPSAIVLIIGLTCSVSVFAGLIHILFGANNINKLLLFAPHFILLLLLIGAIFMDYNFYGKIHDEVTSNNIDSIVVNNVERFTGERINTIVKKNIFEENISTKQLNKLESFSKIDKDWKDSIIVNNL
ncbi:hypothetical protein K5X82_07370 [Halosquirtibacter xylanolyticus]|uniref:hypothetical protein n=1 Tax=Halosquirtibacter xylanolyticus TaxID=3374599 RepID=UPI003749801E|nr:hypothetical protein K5X82_07370 [Prolixibacteraceae bacterium]